MAKFRYKAVDSQGKEVMSTVEADSQGAAIEKIRAMKLTPKAIGMIKEDTPDVAATRPAAPAKPKKKGGGEIKMPKFMRGGVKTKDLMIFTRQLATLVDAGLPLFNHQPNIHITRRVFLYKNRPLRTRAEWSEKVFIAKRFLGAYSLTVIACEMLIIKSPIRSISEIMSR